MQMSTLKTNKYARDILGAFNLLANSLFAIQELVHVASQRTQYFK
jgi:hypothetical protein